MNEVSLSSEALGRVFPLYFVLDEDERFIDVGPVLDRICPKLVGRQLRDEFSIHRPRKFDVREISKCDKGKAQLIAIHHVEGKVALRGQAEQVENGFLFLMGPWTSAPEGHGAGVLLKDYTWHDGGADSVTYLHTQRKAMEESKQAVDRLIAQKEELERAREEAEVAQRSAEVSLVLAEEAKDAQARFLAMMSHEIRTPLNGILGLAELMAELEMTDDLRGMLSVLHGSGGMLKSVLNGVLDYSRIASGKLDLDPVVCDLKEIVSTVAALHRPADRAGSISLELEMPEDPVWVLVDDNRLQQAIGNLLSNAIKFTERGAVTLRLLRDADEQITVQVEDSGIGMSPEQCKRLFEPFEQASGGATARRYGGTGLGLSITAGIIDAMDGRVDIESTPNKGSCFSIRLELSSAEAPTQTSLSRPTVALGTRVLVVDDNPINRMVAEGQLASVGAVVHLAESGAAALEITEHEELDLVLLDLEMPEMNGYQTCVEMRKRGIKIPVIAMTAHGMLEFRRRSEQAGMQGFLTKPASIEELCDSIASVLTAEPSQCSTP